MLFLERVGVSAGGEAGILFAGQEVGAGLADAWQLAVAEDGGLGVVGLQRLEQVPEGCLLFRCAGVGGVSFGGESALVADADRVLVVVSGMGSWQVLVAGLGDVAVAGDVVVVARESESCLMAGYERLYREGAVLACCRAVDNDEVNLTQVCCLLVGWLLFFCRLAAISCSSAS